MYYKIHIPEHLKLYPLFTVLFSAWAAVVVIVFFVAPKMVGLFAISTVFFPLTLYLSGNPRLFLFYGLFLSAPLGLSLNFKRLIHISGAPSYSIDLMDFFLLPLILFVLRDLLTNERTHLRLSSVTFFWGGLILLGVFSIVLGPFRHIAGFETFRMIKCLLLFLVIVNECVRLKHFDHAVSALCLCLLLQVAIGFVQYYIKGGLGLQALGEAAPESIKGANMGVYLTRDSIYRIGGLMGHPNLLSAYLAMTLPILSSLLFSYHKQYIKIILSIITILGTIILLLTLSRSGWLAFGVAIISFMGLSIVLPFMRSRFIFMRIIITITIFFALIAASGPVLKRINKSDSGATNFRVEFMNIAWEMIKDRPVLGFGLNSFVYHVPAYTKERSIKALNKKFGKALPPVHNIYLLTWSEQGTIGFLLFLGLHLSIFRIALRNTKFFINDRLYALNLGCLCGLIALMVDGMASFYIRVPACGRTFWIVVAIIVAIDYWNKDNAIFNKLPITAN